MQAILNDGAECIRTVCAFFHGFACLLVALPIAIFTSFVMTFASSHAELSARASSLMTITGNGIRKKASTIVNILVGILLLLNFSHRIII
jgi:hypothetical protein